MQRSGPHEKLPATAGQQIEACRFPPALAEGDDQAELRFTFYPGSIVFCWLGSQQDARKFGELIYLKFAHLYARCLLMLLV